MVTAEEDTRNAIAHQLQRVGPTALRAEVILRVLAAAVIFTVQESLLVDGLDKHLSEPHNGL